MNKTVSVCSRIVALDSNATHTMGNHKIQSQKSDAAWGLVGYTDLYFHGIPIVPLLGESIICFLGDLEAPGTLRT